MKRSLLILLATLVMNAWGQTVLSGVVTGTDGRPLPGARVALNTDPTLGLVPGLPPTPLGKQAFADETGKYRIENVEPGTYLLVADADGYARQVFGGKAGYFGTFSGVMLPFTAAPVTVAGSGEIAGLDIRMTRVSMLSGRVTTASGTPAEGIAVYAVRWTYLRGVRKLLEQGRATTDNWGAYRIAGLTPGEYFVFAVPPLDTSRGGGLTQRTRPPTFAPNALGYRDAVAVTLNEGMDGSADVKLREDAPVTLRGRVTGPRGPLTSATVALVQDADAPVLADGIPGRSLRLLPVPYFGVTYLRPNGEFLVDVFPGPHRIVAFGGGVQPLNMSSLWGTNVPPGRANELPDAGSMGTVDIATTNENVEGITVALRPGGEITTKVGMDRMSYWDWAREHPDDPSLARSLPGVTLVPEVGVAVGGVFHRRPDDAAGSRQRVSPGRFYVRVEGMDRRYYVKSIRLGGEDVTRKPFQFEGGAVELEVILGTDAGSLGGFAKDREGKVVRGAAVTLWPLVYDFSRRDGGILRTNSRHDGSFYFPLVAPGEYTVIAFQDLPDPGLAEYPSFVSKLAGMGVHATVEPYSGTLASPEIVPPDDVQAATATLQ